MDRRLLGFAGMLFACGPGEDADTREVHPHFTVRGRLDDPSPLLYRIETEGGPVDGRSFRRAIERAMEPWSETGLIEFSEASPDDAHLYLAWRRGAHGTCEPFGASTAVAHSGPVARATFIHFDAGRTWSEDGERGESLFHAAMHEIGHVLGLGHSAAANALMRPDAATERRSLSESERSGLHSLYGGGEDGEGDLEVLPSAGSDGGGPVVTLRRVAPPGITDWTLFDSEGDGDDEVLVWRTDRKGNGALMIYHFNDRLELSRTVGPIYGMSAPGVPNLFVRTRDGERLMICVYGGGKLLSRRFDERGLLGPRAADLPLIVDGGIRDADGDGFLDEPLNPGAGGATAGDLNGDGHLETVAPRDG